MFLDDDEAFADALCAHGCPLRVDELPTPASNGLKEQLAFYRSSKSRALTGSWQGKRGYVLSHQLSQDLVLGLHLLLQELDPFLLLLHLAEFSLRGVTVKRTDIATIEGRVGLSYQCLCVRHESP
jgi:hypothetical protein